MKKVLFGITLLLVAGLFLAGCSKTSELPVDEQNLQDNIIQNDVSPDNTETQDTSDVYVDEQIIDETEGVEIGEMI
jgi:hypothetical protein